jgi:ABC-type nitrate/sulfonate/bicarbonate transport system substrate-binding protein
VQAAHLLAPLAISVSLGLGGHRVALSAPFKLNLNGNQIVVSRAIAARMDLTPQARIADPAAAARALAVALQALGRVPAFGVVHRFSSHALVLRYWLASAGVDPDRDVALRVLPPSFMHEALAAGELDGFCAGEPWGSTAIEAGIGEMAAAGVRIWQDGVEKVLALRQDWMEANPDLVDRLLRALSSAAAWCDDAANHPALAAMLAGPTYVDQPVDRIARALSGRLQLAAGEGALLANFLLFHRGATNVPWRNQAAWIYAQFVRWNLATNSDAARADAEAVFRPDIYGRALGRERDLLPATDPTFYRFFDGRLFDPAHIDTYLAAFRESAPILGKD